MLWRIVLLLLAIPIAWSFGGTIVWGVLGLIPLLGSLLIDQFSNGSAGGLAFYFVFAVAIVMLWVATRALVFFMGFALPHAQRFGATKPARRLQGAFAELAVYGVAFIALGALTTTLGLADDDMARTAAEASFESMRDEALRPLRAALETTQRQADEARARALTQRNRFFDMEVLRLKQQYMNEFGRVTGTTPLSTEQYRPGLFEQSFSGVLAMSPKNTADVMRQSIESESYRLFKPLDVQIAAAENRAAPSGAIDPQLQARLDLERSAVQAKEKEFAGGAGSPKVIEAAMADIAQRPFLWRLVETAKSLGWLLAVLAVPIYAQFVIKGRPTTARLYGRVLRIIEAGRFGFGGSARFAALVEEWGLRWKNGQPALFVGRSLYSRLLHVGLQDPRHMLTIAGSRAGKGTTAIIPNLLTWPGSAVVIDPKGTNAAVTAQRRRDMGHDVYVVDPFEVVIKHLGMARSDAFNAFEALDVNSKTIREDIGTLADALVVSEKGAPMQKHWDDGARTIIGGLITHLLTSPEYKGSTLGDIRRLLNMTPDDQADLWAAMFQNGAAGGRARDAAGRVISGAGTDEIRNIISNANKNTEFLSSAPVADALSRSTFSFGQLREKPTTIYLVLPLNVLKDHNRFLRMFINMTILQVASKGRSKTPILMVLDEFLTLGYMHEVVKAFVFMAGYNLVCWPFIQDYGQLEDIYEGSVHSFITNSRAVQVFGVTDEKSLGFVSRHLGQRSMRQVWGVEQMRTAFFRTPDEVAKEVGINSEGEAGPELEYILRSGRAPMLLEKVKYFEKPDMWARLFKTASPFYGLHGSDPDYGGSA